MVGMTKSVSQSGNQIDPGTRATMIRMARLLYPHDAIPERVYAEVLDQAAATFATTPSFFEMLKHAETALNSQGPPRWTELDETRQIDAMRAIEHMDFFTTIQVTIQTKLYNHPAVWAVLGYEGPSFEKGGYIGRGAGAIDWPSEAH
jgi:hypothetical protein